MDVDNAFLQGDLHEEVYMTIPQGYPRKGEQGYKVCRLEKSLYGLKQASRQWNEKLTHALVQGGFCQSKYDYALFQKRIGSDIVFILAYVDDLLITGNNIHAINRVKRYLHSRFRIKDLGVLKYFLGIEVLRSSHGIFLNQRKYATEMIEQVKLDDSETYITPYEQHLKLTGEETKRDHFLRDPAPYRKLVGKLLYLTLTRPDISFTVQVLSQFMQCPKVSHMRAVLRLVTYLKSCPGRGIFLSAGSSMSMECYCDSDHAGCPDTRRSVTGYLVKLGDSLICWKSKKQNTVSTSSAEAEYRALGKAVLELVWIVGLMKELHVYDIEPVQVYCDNQAAIHIATNPVFHERTKHIEVDCHFVREKLMQKVIAFGYLRSSENLADILTKGLGGPQHQYILGKLGTCDYKVPNLRGSVVNV